ncbi:MAG: hypothetical protein KU37_04370 [Sulfuricurvum sp. PC08-66]|nr:MAG: hypothetical protein KU37_04370 [Sulfuricurvum sp. PC08-66]
MKKFLLFTTTLFIALFWSGCAKEKHIWKINGNSHFNKYQTFLLKGDNFKARYYLEYAIKEAKNSSNLVDLATMHLGSCAMQRALFSNEACTAYDALAPHVHNDVLSTYKDFLFAVPLDAAKLPPKYHVVYKTIQAQNPEVLLDKIKNLPTPFAQAIAANVAARNGVMSLELIDYMIERASIFGYKALMMEWMRQKISFLRRTGREKEAITQEVFLKEIE